MAHIKFKRFFNQATSIVVSASLVFSSMMPSAMAAVLVLPDSPMATSSVAAKTNIMYILDNSGSMAKNYVSTTIDDNNPALMRNGGQCKVAFRGVNGVPITKLKQDGNRLKIKAPTAGSFYTNGFTKDDLVYLAIPGKPHYSGVYKIKQSNYSGGTTATTSCVSGTDVYNSSIIVRQVVGGATYPDSSGTCTTTVGGEVLSYACPVVPGCTPGPKPANDANWFGPGNKRVSNGSGSNINRCAWFDQPDSQIGTVWLSCTTTTTGTTTSPTNGTELEVEIVPQGSDDEYESGDPEIVDAYITMSIDHNTASTPVPIDWKQGSSCPRYEWGDNYSLYGYEPPQNSAEINGLFYNPKISYTPPPQPNKLGVSPPGNLLPSMTSAYTTAWTKVPNDGLRLDSSGNPIAPSTLTGGNINDTPANGYGKRVNLNVFWETVWCDTPNRPASFSNDTLWLQSSRCKKNDLASNSVIKSPTYPYQFPATTKYSGTSPLPASAAFYGDTQPFQYGDNDINAAGLDAIAGLKTDGLSPAGLYVYGEYYYGSTPHYFNVKPIEHCTTAQLTSCQLGGATATHPFPSYVRYCKRYSDASDATTQPVDFSATNPACQAKFTGNIVNNNWNNPQNGNYVFARYGLFERVDIKSGVNNYAIDPATSKVYETRHKEDASGVKIDGDCASDSGCTYDEEMTNFANWWAYYRTRLQLMKSSSANAFNPFNANKRIGFMTINEADGIERNVNGSGVLAPDGIVGKYLAIDDFKTGSGEQKEQWLKTLYGVRVNNDGTPLRDALANAGRIYAGQAGKTNYPSGGAVPNTLPNKDVVRNLPVGDPVQYACQSNFTILTTDGYWNGNAGQTIDGAAIGNQDNVRSAIVPAKDMKYEGAVVAGHPAAPDTLADVAKYYYDTDIRHHSAVSTDPKPKFNNCTNTTATSTDAWFGEGFCYAGAPTQQMKTYTLGLGVDGDMNYVKNYETATSGDFYNRTTTNLGWPVPVGNEPSSVDDLWHAAVNGGGAYYSAKSPADVENGLSEALANANNGVKSGSPPAVTSGEPVAGDYGFSTSFVDRIWTGNLVARNLSTATGSFYSSAAPVWCADTPSSLDTTLTGCPVGLLPTKAVSNTRKILFNKGSNTLDDFTYTNLTTAGLNGYFDDTYLAGGTINYAGNTSLPFIGGLTNWTSISSNTNANGTNLVNFLRGVKTYEATNATPGPTDLFRARSSALGDIIDSDPVFVGQPQFNYVDDNYASYKASKVSRAKMVYIGANDGMLHAFNAKDDPVSPTTKPAGDERFAFIPSILMPKLHKLAEVTYDTTATNPGNHKNFVNGDSSVGDICISNCNGGSSAVWKTILVGSLAQGGRGYYALDITDPDSPSLMWEFDVSHDSDLGYSYGTPVITKRGSEWVVLVTSGYNNTSPGDGKEYLYILKATDGSKLDKIATTAPSNGGLAQISGLALDNMRDNTTQYVYGGDLLGNLWKFDIGTSGAYAGTVTKVAQLKAGSYEQPITTSPILVRDKTSGKTIIIVGTGKLLEHSDASTSDQQTLYGIKDSGGSTFNNPRGDSSFVEQVLTGKNPDNSTVSSTNPPVLGTTYTVTNNAIGSTDNGWFIDLMPRQRQTVMAQLLAGVLRVPTAVTTGSACSPGGYGVTYKLNWATGASTDNSTTTIVSSSTPDPVTGLVYQVKTDSSGNKIGETGASTTNPLGGELGGVEVLNPGETLLGGGEYSGNRLNWRELLE